MIEVKKDEQSPAVAGGMNAEQFDKLMASQRAIWQQLKEIGNGLERLIQTLEAQPAPAPALSPAQSSAMNLRRPLRAYRSFDWSSIGAEVLASDDHGAVEVLWNNEVYIRRTKPKFGADIWFSRGDGQENGKPSYDRLITFLAPRPAPERLPDEIVRALAEQSSNRP